MHAGHAAAKINLALAVTGRRADGYHLIDSLVVFTQFGDEVTAAHASVDDFAITGQFAAGLAGPDATGNLVLRARDALRTHIVARNGSMPPPVALKLVKNLPVASGIGGGSADAAAALRVLCGFWKYEAGPGEIEAIAAKLGADVPMCLARRPLRAQGIGDQVEPLAEMPSFWMVLANPGVAVSTPAIFARLAHRDNPPLALPPSFGDVAAIAAWVKGSRNDLLRPAIDLAPEIGHCLSALGDTRALATGMSGSGATCFAVFGDEAEAREAAAAISARHPSWFAIATRALPSPDACRIQMDPFE